MGSERGIVMIGWAREDRAHDILVKTLARRVVVGGASWNLADALEHMWRWAGPGGEAGFKIGGDVGLSRAGGRPLRLHGKIAGQRLEPEAGMYRRMLLAFDRAAERPDIVILARDGDGRAVERRRGFEQVVNGLTWEFAVILAMPEPESEAWFVCGFRAQDEAERAALAQVTAQLSFDPVTQPHRLTSRPNDAPTDTKRVLRQLLVTTEERKNACLEVELEHLRRCGEHAGLARLLGDLEQHLLPLIDPAARHPG